MKKRDPRPKRPPFRPTPALLAGGSLLLLLSLYGAVGSFTSAFSVQTWPPLLLAGLLVCTAASVLTWSLPRRWWAFPLAVISGLWGLGLWRLWKPLALGGISLRCSVVNTFCSSLSLDGFIQPAVQLPRETWVLCASVLALAVMLPLSLLLSLTILRFRAFRATFWVTLPFPLASICISITPDWGPMTALLLVWCVMGLASLVRRQDPGGADRLTLIALPAGALLLALLTAALPRDSYQRPQWADDALNGLNRWAAHLDIALFGGNGPFGPFGGGGGALSDAEGRVDLSHTGPLRFSGRTVLEVDTGLRGRIYLRGFSSAVYDGGSWGPLREEVYSQLFRDEDDPSALSSSSSIYYPSLEGWQPMNFPALADRKTFPEKDYAKITVHNVGADPGYVYTPYHILSQPDELGGAAFVHDSHITRKADIWTHSLYIQPSCDPLSGARLPAEVRTAEAAYRSFVYQNYLSYPAELRDDLDRAAAELTREMHRGTDVPAYQQYMALVGGTSLGDWQRLPLVLGDVVAAYLKETAEYDPDTPATPEGEDFVSYFLSESHRGYCMHFASAATLMLRYLGVPARYVTGYVTTVPSSGKVNVPDSAAHAWVEVYIDGYGWEPIEVTPAYAGSVPGQSTTTEPTPTPTATPEPTPTAAPQASTAPTPTATPSPGADGETAAGLDLRFLLVPLTAALIFLAFPANRALGRSRREKKFRQADTNQAVIAAYLQLKRLERWGGAIPEDIFALAKKAKFSPHTLTEEEREQAAAAARAAAAQVSRTLPWYKKFWCRYILGLC